MTAVESPDFINIDNTSASSLTEDLLISKSVRIADMARLSTPKPVMYLGSTTEVCRFFENYKILTEKVVVPKTGKRGP